MFTLWKILFSLPLSALSTVVAADANLSLTVVSSGQNSPALGQTFSYNVAPTNTGNVPLDNLVVISSVPLQMQVGAVTTGAYSGLGDLAPSTGVRVSYEKSSAPGVFTLWGFSPNVTTNTTLNTPPPGLGVGEYVTRVRWEYGQAQVGMAATTRPAISGGIVNPDNAGGGVANGNTINHTATLTAFDAAGSTSVNRSASVAFVLGAELQSLVVTTTSDVVDAFDGLTSLREVITHANTLPVRADITFNIPGGGIIELEEQNAAGARMLPILTNPNGITIDGANGGQGPIVIDGGSMSDTTGDRVFFIGVSDGESAATTGFGSLVTTKNTAWAIRNLTIRNGNARGGNGGSGAAGGPGGAGLGGGVFLNAGTLAMTHVSFEGNRAIGGNGAFVGGPLGGGGGGGMGGNGGLGGGGAGGGGGGFGLGADGGANGGAGQPGAFAGGRSGGSTGVGAGGAFGGGGAAESVASPSRAGAGGGVGGETRIDAAIGGLGGFGGGGGGVGNGIGGNGGFGGGGRLGGFGGGSIGVLGTTPGFAGGAGILSNRGGGGAGLGGAIFVRQGASATIVGGMIAGGSASGGAGGNPGLGIGSGIFLAGSATWEVTSGESVTLDDSLGGGVHPQITGGFTKTGPGLLFLNGTHSHTGGTTANDGTLVLDGTLSAGDATTITGTATLGGNGTIVGPVNVTGGGQIYPATGQIGTLRTGPLSFASGTTLRIDVLGAASHDKLESSGAVDLGGATLAFGAGTSLPPGSAPVTILEKQSAGPITGTFAGLSEGSIFNAGGSIFRISYIGGDGNDVTLAAALENLTRALADAPFDLFAATGQAPGSGTFSGPGVSGSNYQPGAAVGVNTITFTPNTGSPVTFTITVTETPSLTVTTLSDTSINTDGLTSLREAIAYLNTGNAGPNPVITFASALKGGLIRLASVLPQITRVVTIDGDIDGDTVPDLTITGDVNDDDTPAAGSTTITDIAASQAAGKLTDNVRIFDATFDLTIDGLVLTGGVTTENGGGIFTSGSVTVSNSIISGSAASSGGGLYAKSSARVSNSNVSGNSSEFGGGGIFAETLVTVSNSTFTGNSAKGNGGAIYSLGSSAVSSSTFGGNSSRSGGGGIYTSGSVTVSNSTFSGNFAVYIGGGLSTSSTANVSNSTFSGNSATFSGGGIHTSGSATVSTSTFSGNSSAGFGGGVYAGSPAVSHSTFSGNSATYAGGGIYVGSNATVTNSTVLGNTAPSGAEIFGDVTAQGLNIIGVGSDTDGSDGVINASSLEAVFASVSANPFTNVLSGTLADNGGPTQTIALKAGSLAIDAASDVGALGSEGVDGTATSLTVVDATFFPAGVTIRIGDEQMLVTAVNGTTLTVTRGVNQTTASAHPAGAPVNHATDQRGQARVRGGTVDIGAFESAPSRLYIDQSVTGGDGNGDSWVNAMPELRTATAVARTDPNVSEIWVASGIYKPAAANSGDRAATFRIRSGLAIYGGFSGGETVLEQRDVNHVTNATVLSGDLNGDDGPNFANNGENTYNVVNTSGSNSSAVIDGFTISGGNANFGIYPHYNGGGLINDSGSPTVVNVHFRGNAGSNAAGMYTDSGNPTLINVAFIGNWTGFGGGGLEVVNGSANVTNAVFSGNEAFFGAGLWNNNATTSLTNVTFAGNSSANNNGGGIRNGRGNLTIRNGIFWDNVGAAISGEAVVTNSIVQGGFTGGTNVLDVDPQFIDAPNGNLRLRSTSPAVNAGDNSVVTAATDLDGAARIIGANVDLGAYELIAPPTLTNTHLTLVNGGTLTDLAALTVAEPGGGVFTGTGISVDGGGKYVFDASGMPLGTQVTITYTVSGPGGTTNTTTATITVLETPSLTVTTTSDTSTNTDGLTSLREAIAHAKTLGGAQSIRFNGDPAALPKATGAGVVDFHDGAPHTLEARSTLVINNQILTVIGTSADRLIFRNVTNTATLISISNGSTVELSGVTVTGANSSGISSQNSDLTLRGCAVSGNAVDSDNTTGGGIYNFGGDLTLVDSTVSDNAVKGGNRFGGGIYNNRGTVLLKNSTVSGNSLNGNGNNYGAGIYNEIEGTMILVNSTVSGNSSIGGTNVGAGIYSVGTLELTNCTVTNNSASGGADILSGVANLGTAHVRNSIISGNTGGAILDWSGPFATDVNNLIGDQPDLRLAPLGAYGGPTMTHALLPGSSAIDAGDNSLAVDESSAALTNDQRGAGFARIVKGSRGTATATVDIGAFELFAAPGFTTDEIEIQIDGRPLDLTSVTGVSPTGGVFSGPGVRGGFFDPRSQMVGSYEITYTYTGDFGIINTSTLIIDVIADGGSLFLQKAKAFPLTQVGRKSKVQRLSLTNRGDLPVTGLRMILRGPGRDDFKITQPVLKTLAPLKSTTYRVSFHPKKPGSRRATVMVLGSGATTSGILKGKAATEEVHTPRDPDRVFPD